MGKGGAKRKRHQPVKGSKRKRYSSPPASKSKGRCSANSPVKLKASDCDVSSIKGLSAGDHSDADTSSVEMKRLPEIYDDGYETSSVEMKRLPEIYDGYETSSVEMIKLPEIYDGYETFSVEMIKLPEIYDGYETSSVEMIKLPDIDDGYETSSVEMIRLPDIDDGYETSSVEMIRWSDSDTADSLSIKTKVCSAGDSADVSPPKKQVESVGCSANDGKQLGVSEDLEKVQYFGTTASGGDEQALQRTKNLSHSAFPDMKQSGFKEIDVKNLAEIFELQGNEAMQSKLYPVAIECYNVAIAFGGDNAIYYCNRAAAYIQTCQYAEAILDCQKSIAIDPNYTKAYTRLGYIYSVQGIDALEKGYRIATLLHPSVTENVRAAEHKIWQQREESGQDTRLQASAMDPSDTNPGELYAAIRDDINFLAVLRLKTNNSNEN